MQKSAKPGAARKRSIDIISAWLPNLLSPLIIGAGLLHLCKPGVVLQVGQDAAPAVGVANTSSSSGTTPSARLLSDWLGQQTVRTENRSARGETSTGLAGVPLIRPEELSGLPRGRQIIMRPEGRPALGHVVPYFRRRDWAKAVDPNPYRRGG